jgi:hypothetical protein
LLLHLEKEGVLDEQGGDGKETKREGREKVGLGAILKLPFISKGCVKLDD